MKIETKIPVEKRISAKSGHTRKLPENEVKICEAHIACGAKWMNANGAWKRDSQKKRNKFIN